MKTLPKPVFTFSEVMSACIDGTDDDGLADRLRGIEASLAATAATYDARGVAQSLYLFKQVLSVGSVTKVELDSLYATHLSATRGNARKYYNLLRSASSTCPLCSIGTVTVLDHHLPKSKYPDLAILPNNLVPACDFCNNAKKAKFPKSAAEQTFHPYYDDFTREQWISATLSTQGVPALQFHPSPPAHWDDILKRRVERHFSVVNLGHSYTTNAAHDLTLTRDYLVGLHTARGFTAVRDFLLDEAQRYSVRVNSWQHVTYKTLSLDEWFINGGFYNIPS